MPTHLHSCAQVEKREKNKSKRESRSNRRVVAGKKTIGELKEAAAMGGKGSGAAESALSQAGDLGVKAVEGKGAGKGAGKKKR